MRPNLGGILVLFVPWLLSSLLSFSPSASWWVAWLGSWFILLWGWSGGAGGIDTSVPWRLRLLHPIYLVQGIFAGYGFLTSIFYWFDISGIDLWGSGAAISGSMEFAAKAQRYYVLAHGSLAAGLLLGNNSRPGVSWQWAIGRSTAFLLLAVAALSALAALVAGFVPGLGQFDELFTHLALVSSVMSLGPCLARSGRSLLPLSLLAIALLLAFALASGWKEEVLVITILLALGTFPFFPKATVVLGSTAFLTSLVVLPVISNVVRQEAWRSGRDRWEALDTAWMQFNSLTGGEIAEINREFQVGRLSEIGMFTKYIESVETGTPSEGLIIAKQSLLAPIPRILWKGKPNMENLVMQRAYAHGVISEHSNVSAKPHPMVDAYLLGGAVGICLSFIGIGLIAARAYVFCKVHFGGYFLGGVFFNGLFSVLWRGNCFEFMFSTLFWGMLLAYGLAWVTRKTGWVKPMPLRLKGTQRPDLRSPITAKWKRHNPYYNRG